MTDSIETLPGDEVLDGYLEAADRAVPRINAESAIVRIERVPGPAHPPVRYRGTLVGVEHYEREPDGTFRKCADALPFEIEIEHDFCRSLDPLLQVRVVRTSPRLVHPNVSGGVCCLGRAFRPATRLPSIVEHFYRIASGRVAATDDPFDPVAAEFFLSHRDEIRALAPPPLWRRPVAREIRVVDSGAREVRR